MKRALVAHPPKLTVKDPAADPVGATLPTVSGKAGDTTEGNEEHVTPAAGVKASPVIWVLFAAPIPLLVSVIVHCRALDGPIRLVIAAESDGATAVKFATTLAGAFIVIDTGLEVLVNLPEKLEKE